MKKYLGHPPKKSSNNKVPSAEGESGHQPPAKASSTGSTNSEETDATEVDEVPTPTKSEIKVAVKKKAAIELEMLAGTGASDSKPNTQLGQEVKKDEKGEDSVDSEASMDEEPEDTVPQVKTSYIRSLRLSSDELKILQLKHGSNEARFSVTSKYQGTSWCQCQIYLFKHSEKVVISDIDGTITKSDFRGHVYTALGMEWVHPGVADLYTRIKNNG